MEVLEEVITTVGSITEIIDKLPIEKQLAAYGELDMANTCIGEARLHLQKARIIAGIDGVNSSTGNAAGKLGYPVPNSA